MSDNLIMKELKHAVEKHPQFPSDMFAQLAILSEEAGEVAKAINDYHYEHGSIEDVKMELAQTVAVCTRMLDCMEVK